MFCEYWIKRGVLGDASEGNMRNRFLDKAARNPF